MTVFDFKKIIRNDDWTTQNIGDINMIKTPIINFVSTYIDGETFNMYQSFL